MKHESIVEALVTNYNLFDAPKMVHFKYYKCLKIIFKAHPF